MTQEAAEPFGEWAVIELMGHRRVVGHVTEATIAGHAFLRVDIPGAKDGEPGVTQFYAPTAVYGIHPTTEDLVRKAAASIRPYEPVQAWQLTPGGPDADDHADAGSDRDYY